MKAKVVIENGQTTIVLTPENKFEVNIMETVYSDKSSFNLDAQVLATYEYHGYSNHKDHRIEINLTPTKH